MTIPKQSNGIDKPVACQRQKTLPVEFSNEGESVQLELKNMQRQWLDDAVQEFHFISHRFTRFTFDQLHEVLPKPQHENWWGVLAAKLKNQGLIRRVNAVASKRPEANGRLVSVWESI